MDTTQTVREIARENPAAVPVFESFGLDYCCGGADSLKDACMRAGVSGEEVLKLLASLPAPAESDGTEWLTAPFEQLTSHIVERHHAFVRREGPRLTALFQKAIGAHGDRHPELRETEGLFAGLVKELATHMLKEEQVLFPYLNRMDAEIRAGRPAPPAFFGSVRNPVARMLADHHDAGAALERISVLTSGYQPPPDACTSFAALYHGLAEFQRDLHLHVHLENNILFARSVEMEKSGAEEKTS